MKDNQKLYYGRVHEVKRGLHVITAWEFINDEYSEQELYLNVSPGPGIIFTGSPAVRGSVVKIKTWTEDSVEQVRVFVYKLL